METAARIKLIRDRNYKDSSRRRSDHAHVISDQSASDPGGSRRSGSSENVYGIMQIPCSQPKPRYFMGAVLAYCGQNEGALRLLRSSTEKNYCSYQALQTDPLLVRLRGTNEFNELLSSAKRCQNRFLAERSRMSP
jgi:hypothetical protein